MYYLFIIVLQQYPDLKRLLNFGRKVSSRRLTVKNFLIKFRNTFSFLIGRRVPYSKVVRNIHDKGCTKMIQIKGTLSNEIPTPSFDDVERKLAYCLNSLSAILGRIYSSDQQQITIIFQKWRNGC